MSDQNDQDAAKGRLSLRPGGRLELGKTVDAGSVRQSFSHGRSKVVQVEVVKKRPGQPGGSPAPASAAPPGAPRPAPPGGPPRPGSTPRPGGPAPARPSTAPAGRPLTAQELAIRQRVLEEQRRVEAERERKSREEQALQVRSAAEEARRREEDESRRREEEEDEARRRAQEEARARREAAAAKADRGKGDDGDDDALPARAAAPAPVEVPAPAAAAPAPPPRPAAPQARERVPFAAPAAPQARERVPFAAPAARRDDPRRDDVRRDDVRRDDPRDQRPGGGGGVGPIARNAQQGPPVRGPGAPTGPGGRPGGAPGSFGARPGGPGSYGDRGPRPGGPGSYGDRGPRPPGAGPGAGPRGPGGFPRPGAPPSSAPAARLSLSPKPREEAGVGDDAPRRRLAGGPAAARRPTSAAIPPKKPTLAGGDRRREGRIDVAAAIEGEDDRGRSLASVRRARERERRQAELARLRAGGERVVRDVVIPETISVQELANRMATRAGEVVKALFRMGVMSTITQSIDADTAELVAQEFGHRVKRVAEDDVEIGLQGPVDEDEALLPRPPVVTIMGHVDHGKTSLLDALRKTDVAAREAGGITQHIGAYQVKMAGGAGVTFIDTPGHEAFTAMRARGASVTDMVVLVVAADDGVMPQTIEAINHSKAAQVPLIVAVNKIDKQGVNLDRVRQELLQHEIVVESLGGEVQEIQVSATKGTNLDKLLEAIQLQAEILDLRANPDRAGEGTVIESKLDRGRGPVATCLVQRGTLRTGDTVVAGTEWGRIRALVDDKGAQAKSAGPSAPVEVLGLTGVPAAGEVFVAVESEARAKEVTEFRQRKAREKNAAAISAGRGTLTDMLARIQAGAQKEVAVVVKADVQGSAEALGVTLGKLGNEEVRVRVLHSAVGQITESDIQLAKASSAVVVAFNVRATVQAREMAQRDGVDIRYYSIIYQVADDIEALYKSKLAPVQRENFLGYATILQVFEVKRLGNIAGCRVTEGVVKRGCGVRLLRENVVIHEGELATLRRFKDDVKEVTNGYECGMSFKNYDDIRVGDQIECFETETVAAA